MARSVSNLPGLVEKLKAHGVNAVVLFNRHYQLDIDINSMEITSGPVFSHPSDFSETLRWTAITSGFVPDFDIACSYGVHQWEDVVNYSNIPNPALYERAQFMKYFSNHK